jgi:hypothetical protein
MNILLGVLYLIAGLAAIVLLPIAVLFLLVLMFLGWAVGLPIKVTQTDPITKAKTTIGHIRWFTFHRYEHGGLAGPLEITLKR